MPALGKGSSDRLDGLGRLRVFRMATAAGNRRIRLIHQGENLCGFELVELPGAGVRALGQGLLGAVLLLGNVLSRHYKPLYGE